MRIRDDRQEDLCSGCDNNDSDDRRTLFVYDDASRLDARQRGVGEAARTRASPTTTTATSAKRETDGALSNDFANGKTTRFDYDSAGREWRMRVWKGTPTEQPLRRRSGPSRAPTGRRSTCARSRASGAVERRYFDTQGRVIERRRAPNSGASEVQRVHYDNLGNRKQDEQGSYEFNARAS